MYYMRIVKDPTRIKTQYIPIEIIETFRESYKVKFPNNDIRRVPKSRTTETAPEGLETVEKRCGK